jgi:hypothetical protein
MAINTLDDIAQGLASANSQTITSFKSIGATVAGAPYCSANVTGFPTSLAAPGAIATGGTVYTNVSANAILLNNGTVLNYLAKLSVNSNVSGSCKVIDLLYGVSWVATVTGAQALTFPAVPARDVNGTANGLGVRMYYMAWTLIGAGASVITVTYTNSDGVANRTASITAVSAAPISRCQEFILQAGDKGVRSIQSINSSLSMVSGTPAIILVRPLMDAPIKLANVGEVYDFSETGLPELYAGTCLSNLWTSTTTTAPTLDFIYQTIDK